MIIHSQHYSISIDYDFSHVLFIFMFCLIVLIVSQTHTHIWGHQIEERFSEEQPKIPDYDLPKMMKSKN